MYEMIHETAAGTKVLATKDVFMTEEERLNWLLSERHLFMGLRGGVVSTREVFDEFDPEPWLREFFYECQEE